MQRHRKIVLSVLTGFVLAFLLVTWFFVKSPEPAPPEQEILPQEIIRKPLKQEVVFEQHPLAMELTAGLNQPEKSAQDDLQALAQVLYAYRQAFKENPIGQNEDVTGALLGANDKRIIFLTKESAPIKEGKLVDRWGSPYWFHPLSGHKMELRSAGPDQDLFTADDVLLE